jgi:tetratricopeptide (TPR) repeat protein
VRAALKWSSTHEPELRLELMLELLAREVDPAVLVTVFRLLASAQPTRNHAAIALSGASAVVTTNQDLLIEEAARRLKVRCPVQHVHGRYDRPGSIITMLSQYVEGLPLPTARALTKAVAGRPIIVVGYSGRDRDLMPLLATARSVLWIQHETKGRPPPPLGTEVEILRSQLGKRFELEMHDTSAYLVDALPATSRGRARTFRARRRARLAIPPDVRNAYSTISSLPREHAIARVVLHVGADDSAVLGVQAARRLYGDSVEGRMIEADALVEMNRRAEAVALYRDASQLARDPATRASALQNAAHALANTSEYAAAQTVLDEARSSIRQIRDARTRARLQGRIASLRGRMKGMTDDESGAMRDYARARRAFRRADDLDGYVEATIFGSDMLRSRGRYREALGRIDEVFADAELYTRAYARAWGPFYRGAIRGAMGDIGPGLDDLGQAAAVSEAAGNYQAIAWTKAMIANYRRAIDLDWAEDALGECAAAIEAYDGPMFQCAARLLWERAELARARRRDAEVRAHITELQGLLTQPESPGPLPYLHAHILAVEGELARDTGDPSAEARLRDAATAYRRGRWAACVARIEVSLWMLHDGPPPKWLLTQCRREGYGHELNRLEGRRSDTYYPLHTL